jgi:acetate kinase
MSEGVLILDAGCSTLKFHVYTFEDEKWTSVGRGQIEGIGSTPKFAARDGNGALLIDRTLPGTVRDVRASFDVLSKWLRDHFGKTKVSAVGHRVIHGGTKYGEPCVVTPQVLEDLRALIPLAPLHQPHNIAAIEVVADGLKDIPQVACFDTGFHRSMPPVAQLVALPADIRAGGVRRYGFHGISYEYIASVLPRLAPQIAGGRVIVAHLGSGASLCAMKAGRSIDCTFSMTPLDGLCMATRPGSTDPGIVLYLFQTLGFTPSEVEKILYKKSGLLGLSGISNDMRVLEESSDPRAKLALDYFVYQAAKHIGALAAVLGGVDGIVFTAGIGEHSAEMRHRICDASAWLGIELNSGANARHALQISKDGSRTSAWVIPTNEELVIAGHTGSLLGLGQPALAGEQRSAT